MSIKVNKSLLKGIISAPSSKSMTHRAVILAALSKGTSTVIDPLISEDTMTTAKNLEKIGAKITKTGTTWTINGGKLTSPREPLDCHESGTTLRLLTGISSIIKGATTLTGAPSLMRRPMKPLIDGLTRAGIKVEVHQKQHLLVVHGGVLQGGEVSIRGDISSQYVSSLLLVAPYAETTLTVKVTTHLESKPYVQMTIDAMKAFGVNVEQSDDMRTLTTSRSEYKPTRIRIEGDWSSAAFIIVAGVLGGEVTVENLNFESSQADQAIISILEEMGAKIKTNKEIVVSKKSRLNSIDTDLSDCPDLFPIVAVLCASANGTSVLRGIERLRIKESDRIQSMVDGLTVMGCEIKVGKNTVTITGSSLKGAKINPYNDHRIAMSFAVLGLSVDEGTEIMDPECVAKSYPEFWSHMEQIGAKMERVEDE